MVGNVHQSPPGTPSHSRHGEDNNNDQHPRTPDAPRSPSVMLYGQGPPMEDPSSPTPMPVKSGRTKRPRQELDLTSLISRMKDIQGQLTELIDEAEQFQLQAKNK